MFKKFFTNISAVPIIGGALAAVTSFLLSAKIGIGGSVIGVAVGSVVSAVSSQLYQNVLKVSGQKIQEKVEWVGGPDAAGEPQKERRPRIAGGSGAAAKAATRTMGPVVMHSDAVEDMSATDGGTSVMHPVDDGGTRVMPPVTSSEADASGATRVMPAVPADASDAADGSTSVMPAVAGGAASETKSTAPASFAPRSASGTVSQGAHHADARNGAGMDAKTRRKALAITIAAALIAVGVTSALILAFTGGQGTDDVVKRNLPKSVQTTQTTTPSPQQTQGVTPTPQQTATDQPTTQSNGSDTTDDSGNGSTGSDSGTSSTTGGDTTNNGSNSTGSDSGTSSTTGGDTTNNGSGTTGSENGTSGNTGTNNGSNSTGGTESGTGSTGNATGDGTTGSGSDGSAN
ncbi:hypothetical protein DF200_07565 [Bifidobacterium catulorum]|uniref:Uncharacterized protein n=1 Tax=Bifidobacterium catulorum TaxID=1630173 RepID=A0A2U2MRJ4_9BIFI|nr:hypothetical protein DF200_07565 [Bifidobacterium catulorum]